MKCPYCDNEMGKGYISQTDFRYPLEWYPAKREPGFLASNKGNVKLTNIFKNGHIVVYRCEQCKKMIIDENTLEV